MISVISRPLRGTGAAHRGLQAAEILRIRMPQSAVKIFQHRLASGRLLRHGLIPPPHRRRHLALAQIAPDHLGIRWKAAQHPLPNLFKIGLRAPKAGCPEEKDLLPSGQTEVARMKTEETRIALVGIILTTHQSVGELNALLSEYSDYIIGRMGIPYREKHLSIISVALDAPGSIISALSGKLGMLPGVSTKTIYARTPGSLPETPKKEDCL